MKLRWDMLENCNKASAWISLFYDITRIKFLDFNLHVSYILRNKLRISFFSFFIQFMDIMKNLVSF